MGTPCLILVFSQRTSKDKMREPPKDKTRELANHKQLSYNEMSEPKNLQ